MVLPAEPKWMELYTKLQTVPKTMGAIQAPLASYSRNFEPVPFIRLAVEQLYRESRCARSDRYVHEHKPFRFTHNELQQLTGRQLINAASDQQIILLIQGSRPKTGYLCTDFKPIKEKLDVCTDALLFLEKRHEPLKYFLPHYAQSKPFEPDTLSFLFNLPEDKEHIVTEAASQREQYLHQAQQWFSTLECLAERTFGEALNPEPIELLRIEPGMLLHTDIDLEDRV